MFLRCVIFLFLHIFIAYHLIKTNHIYHFRLNFLALLIKNNEFDTKKENFIKSYYFG